MLEVGNEMLDGTVSDLSVVRGEIQEGKRSKNRNRMRMRGAPILSFLESI